MNEQAQQKLPPLALLKLSNQVQSGGAGEEYVGPGEEDQSAGAREWGRGDTVMFRGSEGKPQHDSSSPLRSGTRPGCLQHQDSEEDRESEAAPLTLLTSDLSL